MWKGRAPGNEIVLPEAAWLLEVCGVGELGILGALQGPHTLSLLNKCGSLEVGLGGGF